MYLPPYDSLLNSIGLDRSSLDRTTEVKIPRPLFDFLLQLALANAEFEEESYLAANPDIQSELGNRSELTPKQHFVGFGYYEGRRGGLPKVDERWYLRTYKDVADAVASGRVSSAAEHFQIIGAAEGRAPSQQYLVLAKRWKELLVR